MIIALHNPRKKYHFKSAFDIESERTGGCLAFKREMVKQETPEGYFDEKRNAFFFGENEEDE